MGGGDAADDGVDSSNDVGEEVIVNIRCSNGSKLTVQVNLYSTVEFFKLVLASKCEIPAQQQRLVYQGRIMKDDRTLQSYGVEADHTVHLVRGFVTAAPADHATIADAGARNANSISTMDVGSSVGGPLGESGVRSSSLFPGLGLGNVSGMFRGSFPELEQLQHMLTQNPNMISYILNMPAVQNLINNPEIIRNLMISNPQMREIMDRNPEFAHVLNDPAFLRRTMEAARNPEVRREMMRHTDRAISNIESTPGGFNMLRRIYENVQEPFLNATTLRGDSRSDIGSNPFAAFLGTQGSRSGRENLTNSSTPTTNSPAPNTNPLPNPWGSAGARGMHANLSSQVNPTGNVRPHSPVGLGGIALPNLERMLGSMPDLTSINQLMQNPLISQMMRNLLSSPQSMNQILALNSQLQNMLASNPQLRAMMQNPELIRQLTSPETMQQLLKFPGALSSQVGRQTSREQGQNDRGTVAGTADNMGLNMLMNLFSGLGTGSGIATPNRPHVPPEELYATQLSQLREMGFVDNQENIRALVAAGGNVHAAVERLLGNPGQ